MSGGACCVTGATGFALEDECNVGMLGANGLHDLRGHLSDDDDEALQSGLFVGIDGADDRGAAEDREADLVGFGTSHALASAASENDTGDIRGHKGEGFKFWILVFEPLMDTNLH